MLLKEFVVLVVREDVFDEVISEKRQRTGGENAWLLREHRQEESSCKTPKGGRASAVLKTVRT